MQAAVLLCQTCLGPRCFVPKRFLPAKYDYQRAVVPREVAQGALDSGSTTDVETGDGGGDLPCLDIHTVQADKDYSHNPALSSGFCASLRVVTMEGQAV